MITLARTTIAIALLTLWTLPAPAGGLPQAFIGKFFALNYLEDDFDAYLAPKTDKRCDANPSAEILEDAYLIHRDACKFMSVTKSQESRDGEPEVYNVRADCYDFYHPEWEHSIETFEIFWEPTRLVIRRMNEG